MPRKLVVLVYDAGIRRWNQRRSMPLAVGPRLGPYGIESALGAGGMGEVYRARDTRIERVVIPDQRVRATLALMRQAKDARLTADIAREVCERTGSAAVLEGSIAGLGSRSSGRRPLSMRGCSNSG